MGDTMDTEYVRRDDNKPSTRMYMEPWPRIPIIADPSMPPNTLEVRSGDQRVRIRWPDETTEIDRWADDGGRA